MKTFHSTLLAFMTGMAAVSCTVRPADGEYRLEILTTNDVHGSWFDSTYVGPQTRKSLLAVNTYADSIRNAVGSDNVILIDAGDCMQGDNASYYFNYVDTAAEHLFSRMAEYMRYDAVVVGNHDIETGHKVYDRVAKELKHKNIAFLAGNAISTDNGKPYFETYRILKKNGLKVAVIGFTNPNIKAWLSEEIWSGMTFESLMPLAQETVDKVIEKEKPEVVIVAVHSGTGDGENNMLESQGLDLFRTLRGVDFLICSHDHRPFTANADSICLINSGSHCRNIGHGTITLSVKDGKVSGKHLECGLIPVRAEKADAEMRETFQADYLKVKQFTNTEIGDLGTVLQTRDAFTGMCPYIDLIQSVTLACQPARIAFAAPLTYNGRVEKGTLIYNDLFTIYPFENQVFVINMTGREIKDYLEYSYDQWICRYSPGNGHLLKIAPRDDPRTGQKSWSFIARSYNFDSAAGLVYSVNILKDRGERIEISSMADGTAFDMDETYPVAMTSYRASGGGGLLRDGAGIDTDKIEERVIRKYPELRSLLYDYILEHKNLDESTFSEPSIIGRWSFVPEEMAAQALEHDMSLLFR